MKFLLPVLLVLWPLAASAGLTVGTLTLEHTLSPGDTAHGTLTVTNSGGSECEAELYQTDYTFASDGSNQFGEPGTVPRSNASWIRFSPHHLTVPPGQTLTVRYELHVPEDANLRGTYWSIIMIEEVPPPDTMIYLARNQTAVRHVMRCGVQCVTHIGGGAPEARFVQTQLLKEGDQPPELQVDVLNAGERWLVPTAWMELYTQSGDRLGRFEGEKKRIFPGTSVRFRIPIQGMPAGSYKALVVLDNGDANLFGARYDLEF